MTGSKVVHSRPLLTIVVPVYNGKMYIQDTLDSLEVLEKTIGCEIIFQNCYSTDGTTEILDNFCREKRNRFHCNEKDSGQSDAINKGINRAKGKWVTWLCADDILLPSIAEILEEGDKNSADIVYGDIVFINGKKSFPAVGTESYSPGALAKRRLIIQQPGTCILREAWQESNGVRGHLNWSMDYDLFMRMESAGKKFHRSKRFVAVIRIHGDAKTSSGSIKRMFELWSIIRESHKRRSEYFHVRPYIVYGVEYVIKAIEAADNSFFRILGRVILKPLHKFFWIVANPAEKENIMLRFNTLEEDTVKYVKKLITC